MNQFAIYKKLPVFLQNILCSVQGYRLEKQRYNKDYYKIYNSLLESDQWNESQILAYKEEHIDKIIEYAFKHYHFYKKKYTENGLTALDFKGMEDLAKFPILTKEEIRENWKGMISDETNIKKLIPYHTSGSTGKALDFYWTSHSLQYYWAVVWRGRQRFEVYKGDRHLNFTGKIVIPIEQNKPPYWRYNKPLNQYMLNMQHLTPQKVKDIVNFINQCDFKFFVGYPSIMNTLANLIEEQGLIITNTPEYIFSSAEKMYENQQQNICKAFPGTTIIEHYGFSENAASASKCKRNVYHEDFELGHLEINNPVKTEKGVTGSMVATGFQNFAMPFIRYEIGDTGTFTDKKCDCGLQSQVITDIEGRNGDYVITPEGAHIMRFGYIFKETSSIKECQIVQKELGSLIVRIVKRDNYNKSTEENIREAIKEWISPTIRVNFEYVNEIPRTKSGKFKAVVSELRP